MLEANGSIIKQKQKTEKESKKDYNKSERLFSHFKKNLKLEASKILYQSINITKCNIILIILLMVYAFASRSLLQWP